jgi:hypothetical protein
MKTCQFCGSETDAPVSYYSMTPIIPHFEEKINELGRKDWFENIDMNNPTPEQEQLMLYDQLINTVGKGVVCRECNDKDDILYLKFYGD